ncbi:hypothetical protein [Natronoglycomyces albus]|uniref:Uncharacterized protein n=1 Tax=Natronoglycomyces albus TaxID=2811108 RepID=A0A895XNF4_9ACTN|nr:hypothetical protein [Natronoglycomyces albus]QSB04016.1 hypothetical protein JQS30_09285 [Natronoglycomyces albus]
MLPQPSQRHDGRPPQIKKIQIALWVQATFALCGGNLVALTLYGVQSASVEELREAGFAERPPTGPFWILVVLLFLTCAFAAMAAGRLSSQLPIARKWAIAASVIYFAVGSTLVMFAPNMVLVLAIPLVACMFSLFWLFSADVKEWFTPK